MLRIADSNEKNSHLRKAGPQIRIEMRERLHLDLERVQRLSHVDGGRGSQ